MPSQIMSLWSRLHHGSSRPVAVSARVDWNPHCAWSQDDRSDRLGL